MHVLLARKMQQLHCVHNRWEQTVTLQLDVQKPARLKPGTPVAAVKCASYSTWGQHINQALQVLCRLALFHGTVPTNGQMFIQCMLYAVSVPPGCGCNEHV